MRSLAGGFFQRGKKISKFLSILGQHPNKPDPISNGSIARNNLTDRKESRITQLKRDIQWCADFESKQHFDVESAQTQIGSLTANRTEVRFWSQFDR